MQALKIQNVEKRFGKVEVLKGINLEIEPGQFLILVGPSGCGKSTLLNMIAGLESVSSGKVLIGDRDVTDLSPKDRDIAMVFQSYALYPNMTVRQNISFGLDIRKVPKTVQTEIVSKVASMLQIEPLLDRKPKQLSGGQRQRVAMGRALARDPSIYLFDEPLSNLDAKLRVEMRREIKELHQRVGTTIVYVTHDQIEAMTLGDMIAVMKDGVLQQFGPPQEIYDNPANQFVAGFMGSPSMNFIPCRVEEKEGDLALFMQSGTQVQHLAVTASCPALRDRVGQTVVLGIRPEQITSADSSTLEAMECVVEVVEPTGPDVLVTVALNNARVVCRVHPGIAVDAGQRLPLQFDMSKAVFFDAETERRIL